MDSPTIWTLSASGCRNWLTFEAQMPPLRPTGGTVQEPYLPASRAAPR